MHRKTNQLGDMKSATCPKCGSSRLLYSKGKLSCTNCGEVIGETLNKFGAKKSNYKGFNYDSKFEAQHAQELDLRVRVGEIKSFEKQVKIPLYAYGKFIANYYIDFVITHNDGHLEYVETKGYETDVWKMKWKMFEAKINSEDPTAELTVVKQRTFRKRS